MISILSISRRRSRFLSHFLFSYFANTSKLDDLELIIMCGENDDYNADCFEFFKNYPVKFLFENRRMGVKGRHIYFNDLLAQAKGDWVMYTCDDQIFFKGWDQYIRNYAAHTDHNKIHCLIPRMKNQGYVDHLLSRGYINTVGGLGNHWNIDSWNNLTQEFIPQDRIHVSNQILMDDLTVFPEMFEKEYLQGDKSQGEHFPMWNRDDPALLGDCKEAARKINEAIKNGL